MKPWDTCALGLTRPNDPVITPHGVLYEREAILRELLRQREHARALHANHVDKRLSEQRKLRQRITEQERDAVERFEMGQSQVLQPDLGAKRTEDHQDEKRRRVDRSADSNFWVPSIPARIRAPPSDATKPSKSINKKISIKTCCPISKKPLRSKDLITLKPTPNVLSKTDTAAGKAQTADKYMCPVCQSVLVNAIKPIALRTGTVLCSRCVAQFVMNEGKDPCTSAEIDVDHDVIPVFNVGTAFAASAGDDPASHEASVYRPSVT